MAEAAATPSTPELNPYDLLGQEEINEALNKKKPEAAASAEPVLKEYKFQPKDEHGVPLGGVQVIKYKDEQELADQLAHNYEEAQRHIRKLRREQAIGQVTTEEGVEALPKARPASGRFQPKQLTEAEEWQLTRDLQDPATAKDARRRLIEVELGASPEEIRNTLTQATEDISAMRARQEAEAFCAEQADFYRTQENVETMVQWMQKRNLQPIKENFHFAYKKLSEAALLTLAPIADEGSSPKTQADAEPEGRITRPEPTQTKRSVPTSSGLTRNQASSGSGGSGSGERRYTDAEIDAMTAEEYRKKVLEPMHKRAGLRQR